MAATQAQVMGVTVRLQKIRAAAVNVPLIAIATVAMWTNATMNVSAVAAVPLAAGTPTLSGTHSAAVALNPPFRPWPTLMASRAIAPLPCWTVSSLRVLPCQAWQVRLAIRLIASRPCRRGSTSEASQGRR